MTLPGKDSVLIILTIFHFERSFTEQLEREREREKWRLSHIYRHIYLKSETSTGYALQSEFLQTRKHLSTKTCLG